MIYKTYDIKNVGPYQVSSDGKIRRNGKELKGSITPKGYIRVNLQGRKTMLHRVIAEAYLGKPKKNYQVNHKNGIKTDNRIENLEWVTPSENLLHAYRELGRKAAFEGKRMPEEIKKKISKSNKGRKIPELIRIKNSESHKGHGLLALNPNAKPVKCLETGKIYGCIKEAAIEMKANPMCLYDAIRNHKKYKNLTFLKGETK